MSAINGISDTTPHRGELMVEGIKNINQGPGIFRTILDAICEFFTLDLTTATQERLLFHKAVNEAIVDADDEVGEYGRSPDRLMISIYGSQVELVNNGDMGVYVRLPSGECSHKIKGTEGKTIAHMIAEARLRQYDMRPELSVQTTPSECAELLSQVLKNQGYQCYGIEDIRADTAVVRFPRMGEFNFDGLEAFIARTKAEEIQYAQQQGIPALPIVTILPLIDAPGLFGINTNHFVACIISPDENTKPVIIDSKSTITRYPDTIKIIRSGHQSLVDDTSCGAHSVRALVSILHQIECGITVDKITLPSEWSEQVGSGIGNGILDADDFINNYRTRQREELEAGAAEAKNITDALIDVDED